MEEQDSQSQIPQQPVMPPAPAPHSHMLMMVLVGLVMIGIGLAGGYFLFGNKTQQSSINTQVIQVSPTIMQESSSPTVDQTATWKTYTNDNLSFSIKHPAEYKLDETNGSVVIYKGEKLKTQQHSPIDPYPINTTLSILDRGSDCGDCSVFKLEEIKIAGYRAQKVLDIKNFNDIYLYNNDNNKVFRIGYGFDPELDMILSTFKFTN